MSLHNTWSSIDKKNDKREESHQTLSDKDSQPMKYVFWLGSLQSWQDHALSSTCEITQAFLVIQHNPRIRETRPREESNIMLQLASPHQFIFTWNTKFRSRDIQVVIRMPESVTEKQISLDPGHTLVRVHYSE